MQLIRVSIVKIEQPIRNRQILKFRARSIGLSLVGIQQGYPKERIIKKIKSVHIGYRDLAIGIKGFQYKSFQLSSFKFRLKRGITLNNII